MMMMMMMMMIENSFSKWQLSVCYVRNIKAHVH